jgi:hypothetical protein
LIDFEDSFILNEASPLERDHLYKDTVQTFFVGKALKTYTYENDRALKDKFFAVSSFDYEGEEYVAMLEGKRAPIFGYMYSPQKSQFSVETVAHAPIEQTMQARYHSQFLANYFIDAARESWNRVGSFKEETRMLINRFPSVFVEERLPVEHSKMA